MAVALLVVGAVVSAFAAYKKGQAEKASYQSAAKANAYNAQALEQNATQRMQEANANEEAQRREARQVLGGQRAAIAESGAGFGGTYGGVMRDSSALAELDALNIRYRGKTEATGLLNQSTLERYYGKANKMNAKSAMTAGYLNAASALTFGLASAAQAAGGKKG